MISGKLKNIIYTKRINKALKGNHIPSKMNSGKIGLIIDAENVENKAKLFEIYRESDFRKDDLSIVICGTAEAISDDWNAAVLDTKEITVSGDFKSESIKSFSSEKFDFLICHFTKRSKTGSLLAAETKACVKIGNSPDDYGIYDVEVHADEIEIFQQEVLKYIEILKKNN
ncbi:DUF6913 domain-containing protein [Christiangramia sp. SM2212]|uniref:Uncharacterized protein n=1 Tax=Christiangramia sediminicola TaxID=3073267 RepID=A0ABU1EN12_9FLAO|nr:hypothetical protein [Christiangramia sp. SM2212]MDR5589777.1 hypothetical protein [Christiangramia sp. SM2212]